MKPDEDFKVEVRISKKALKKLKEAESLSKNKEYLTTLAQCMNGGLNFVADVQLAETRSELRKVLKKYKIID